MKLFLLLLFSFSATAVNNNSVQIVTEELPPYNYTENNEIKGVSAEVVSEILVRLNLQPQTHVLPWARAYQMALTQKNTLIYSIARGASRELHFKWVGETAPYQSCLFKLSSRGDVKATNIEQAKNYVTGAMLNSRTGDHMIQNQFTPNENFVFVNTQEATLKMLLKEHIDLIAGDSLAILYLARKNGLDPHTQLIKVGCLSEPGYVYLAFSLSTPDRLVNQFRTALLTLKEDGTYEAILSRYL